MKVFFDYETLSFWSYEKPSWKNVIIMPFLFSNFIEIFLKTNQSYLSKKSDCQFHKWSSVTFQKNEKKWEPWCEKSKGWSTAYLRSVYQFWGHLIWAPNFCIKIEQKTNHSNLTGLCSHQCLDKKTRNKLSLVVNNFENIAPR